MATPPQSLEDLGLDESDVLPLTSAAAAHLPQYIDLDTLRNADGIISIISQRRTNGVITFALFKEFERDRRTDRTSFFGEYLIKSYAEMVELTSQRIVEIRNNPKLLRELQLRSIKNTIAGGRR